METLSRYFLWDKMSYLILLKVFSYEIFAMKNVIEIFLNKLSNMS